MAAKFEIFLDRKKQYRFHLRASNGEIIAASEAYETKVACIKGIKSIQKNAPAAAIIDPGEAAKRRPRPRLLPPKPKKKSPAVASPKPDLKSLRCRYGGGGCLPSKIRYLSGESAICF
jgi:uncharacterized protein YegP (UPF0339 family)